MKNNIIQDNFILRKNFDNFCILQKLIYQTDWYSLRIRKINGVNEKKQVNVKFIDRSNLFYCLSQVYPEVIWKAWQFSRVPSSYWSSLKNQKYYISQLEIDLNIQKIENWYSIPSKKLGSLYHQYISTHLLLKNMYPEYIWLQWRFSQIPIGCWELKFNRRQNFNDIFSKEKINSLTNSYSLTNAKVYKHRNTSYLKKYYQSNLFYCFSDLYPEQNWQAWKFSKVPYGFWSSIENRTLYFKQLEKEFNIGTLQDWYSISKFPNLKMLLKIIYPNYHWKSWRFGSVSNRFWESKYNRRQYFDDILKNNFSSNEQNTWYSITIHDLLKVGSGSASILECYNQNVSYCILDIYPETIWLPWKFCRVPTHFWKEPENILQFLKYCEKKLNIENTSQWNFVKYEQLIQLGGNSLLRKYKGIPNILQNFYPNYEKQNSFTNQLASQKSQYYLFNFLKNLLPDEIIYFNYKHPNLFFQNSKKKIEFDIFLPSLNLGFEYQGQQHMEDTLLFGNSFNIKKRDKEKKDLCKNNSITLIEIPYNWQELNLNILKLIKNQRPDI